MPADRDARYSALFRQHHAAVWRFVSRRAWPDAVDDIVADTFLAAWRRFDDLPHDALPWLFNAAGKCLANHRRATTRGEALIARLRAEAPPPGGDPGARSREREALILAFMQLSEPERELLMLTEWDGLPARRAAAALGISSTTARTRIHRARKKLRVALAAELGIPLTTSSVRNANEIA